MGYLLGKCIDYFQRGNIHVLSCTKTKTSRYIESLKADIELHKIFVDLARYFGLVEVRMMYAGRGLEVLDLFDMVYSDTCKGTLELTLISSRCGDTCARDLWQREGIPSIGMDLAGCLSMLLARRSGSCLEPVKREEVDFGSWEKSVCAEAHFKSGADIPAFGIEM